MGQGLRGAHTLIHRAGVRVHVEEDREAFLEPRIDKEG